MDQYSVVIILAFLGFVALAAVLLVPIYLFLKKEDAAGEAMNEVLYSERESARAADSDS